MGRPGALIAPPIYEGRRVTSSGEGLEVCAAGSDRVVLLRITDGHPFISSHFECINNVVSYSFD